MSYVNVIRDHYIPIFKHAVECTHERLKADDYQTVKEFIALPNHQKKDAAFFECFKTDDGIAYPVNLQTPKGKADIWVVDYVTFGTEADVHTRVTFTNAEQPTVDPIFIIKTSPEE